jgi:hypothetical protein
VITTAFMLAVLVTASFAILYLKLPAWIKNFLDGRYVLLDILIGWAAFSSLGFAMVGYVAAGFICLITSAYLYWLKKKRDEKRALEPQTEPGDEQPSAAIRTAAYLYNTFLYSEDEEEDN